jgi:hypothetical protein
MFLVRTCSVVVLEDHHSLRLLLWLHRLPLSLHPAAAVAPARAQPQGRSTSVTQVVGATSRAPTCSVVEEEELRRRALTYLVAGMEPYQVTVQQLMQCQRHPRRQLPQLRQLRRQLPRQLRQSTPAQLQEEMQQRETLPRTARLLLPRQHPGRLMHLRRLLRRNHQQLLQHFQLDGQKAKPKMGRHSTPMRQ